MSLPSRLHDGFLPGRHPIQGFGQGGFRFGEMSHRGSVLALPSGLYDWGVETPFLHDPAYYDRLFDEAASIDIVVIGTGTMPLPLPESLRWRFRDARTSADIMTTASACSTYNVLLGEGRRVAAAFVAVA